MKTLNTQEYDFLKYLINGKDGSFCYGVGGSRGKDFSSNDHDTAASAIPQTYVVKNQCRNGCGNNHYYITPLGRLAVYCYEFATKDINLGV